MLVGLSAFSVKNDFTVNLIKISKQPIIQTTQIDHIKAFGHDKNISGRKLSGKLQLMVKIDHPVDDSAKRGGYLLLNF